MGVLKNPEDIKPNSHKYREEQRERTKLQKVVTGPAKLKQRTAGHKLADIFISEDIDSVKSYIFMDVLVPAVKKAISDIVSDGINMILYGGTRTNNKRSSNVSYRSYYDERNDRRPSNSTTTNSGYKYGEVTLETRGEAEAVLTRMDELIDTYGVVSVADMYDLAGVSCEYTDNNYGWTNIRNATVIRGRDGYVLKMPKALPIK